MIVTTTTQINTLPENLRQYIQARAYGNITTLKPNELKDFCLLAITYVHNFCGVKDSTSAEVLAEQTNLLRHEVLPQFKLLTKEEITLAFKIGVRGDAGQFMGLNPKTYHQWLKHFVESKERQEAIKLYLEISEPKPIEKTMEEKKAILITAAKQYFAEYKESNIFKRHWHSVYDIINEKNGTDLIINDKTKRTLITDSEIRRLINIESRKEYVDKLEHDADDAMKSGRFVKAKEIKDMINHLDTNTSYKFTQKKNALKYYFDSLIKAGKELEL